MTVFLITNKHLNTLEYNDVDSNSIRHRCLLLSCLLSVFFIYLVFWGCHFVFFDRNGKEGHECQFVFAELPVLMDQMFGKSGLCHGAHET